MKQSLFGQDQVHGAHAAKTVKSLQLGHTVFPFFKFTYKQMKTMNEEPGAFGFKTVVADTNLLARMRHDSETM